MNMLLVEPPVSEVGFGWRVKIRRFWLVLEIFWQMDGIPGQHKPESGEFNPPVRIGYFTRR